MGMEGGVFWWYRMWRERSPELGTVSGRGGTPRVAGGKVSRAKRALRVTRWSVSLVWSEGKAGVRSRQPQPQSSRAQRRGVLERRTPSPCS